MAAKKEAENPIIPNPIPPSKSKRRKCSWRQCCSPETDPEDARYGRFEFGEGRLLDAENHQTVGERVPPVSSGSTRGKR
uniref:Uncharacterized protein n=1 Tax=Anopheles atroparvus TaxID=41427 RepID=A0AAG5D2P6_ANOAO